MIPTTSLGMYLFIDYWLDSASLFVTRVKTVGPFHILIGILCVHALVVNIFFGHPTYWRQQKPKRSGSSDKLAVTFANRTWDLERVHPDILRQIFGYLNPKELTVIAQVSKKYRSMSHDDYLWSCLIVKIPAALRDQYAPHVPNESARHRYFKLLHLIATGILANNEKLIVRIHGELYDLTHFAAEHPGGMAVLEQYQGGDGTRIFDLAKHSEFARELSLNLMVFSPADYIGAPGLPNFALQLIADAK